MDGWVVCGGRRGGRLTCRSIKKLIRVNGISVLCGRRRLWTELSHAVSVEIASHYRVVVVTFPFAGTRTCRRRLQTIAVFTAADRRDRGRLFLYARSLARSSTAPSANCSARHTLAKYEIKNRAASAAPGFLSSLARRVRHVCTHTRAPCRRRHRRSRPELAHLRARAPSAKRPGKIGKFSR